MSQTSVYTINNITIYTKLLYLNTERNKDNRKILGFLHIFVNRSIKNKPVKKL